jgi:predicted Na+-dependent transporter
LLSPRTAKIVAMVLFFAIMSLWGMGVQWFFSLLPETVVHLIGVGMMCGAAGFLLGQRHGIER